MTVESFTVKRIQDATADEVDQAATIAANSLFEGGHGVLSRLGCGGDKEQFLVLQKALAKCAARHAYLYVAIEDSSKTVVGCLSAYAPDTTQVDVTVKEQEFVAFLADLDDDLKPFWTTLAPALVYLIDQLIGKGGKKPVWAINSFATKLGYRNKGLARLLLAEVDKLATANKKPIYCEAMNYSSIAAGIRLGFEIHELVLPIAGVTKSPFAILRKEPWKSKSHSSP